MKKMSNVYGGGRMMNESSIMTSSSTSTDEEIEWEMRPGGMLVQKRISNPQVSSPNLRLRIAFGALGYEISINSRATFGEVKKLLTAESGLQPVEQKLIFRGKERENGEYLDMCGVKDRSKLNLIEDPCSIERRFIEMRRNAKIQNAQRTISDVSMEIDKLAEQDFLCEMPMRQAIKLDGIPTKGEASAPKNLQLLLILKLLTAIDTANVGKRVQKCVETLDMLKISNAKVKPVDVTTKWKTFDPPPTTAHWEFFD